MPLAFEWNLHKAELNLKKHDLDFDEAASVFTDALARIFTDEAHSATEHREIIIGHSSSKRLVLVCFTEVAKERIRIISARCATRREKRDYEENIAH
jgi:uncharacterized DUF497 family protein